MRLRINLDKEGPRSKQGWDMVSWSAQAGDSVEEDHERAAGDPDQQFRATMYPRLRGGSEEVAGS